MRQVLNAYRPSKEPPTKLGMVQGIPGLLPAEGSLGALEDERKMKLPRSLWPQVLGASSAACSCSPCITRNKVRHES